MSKANKTNTGSPKYLYNPRNKRVMIATPEKMARRDENDDPYFVPCDSPQGPDGPGVVQGTTKESKPEEVVPGADATEPERDANDLLDTIMASSDKEELVSIGEAIGVKLTRAMKPETMKTRLQEKVDELSKL